MTRGILRNRGEESGYRKPVEGNGIAALEDKTAQYATGTDLNQIWEEDFLGFRYGFQPGRDSTMHWTRCGWGSCSTRGWVQFVEHRIGDKRVVRPIQKMVEGGRDGAGRVERDEGRECACEPLPALRHGSVVEAWRKKPCWGSSTEKMWHKATIDLDTKGVGLKPANSRRKKADCQSAAGFQPAPQGLPRAAYS